MTYNQAHDFNKRLYKAAFSKQKLVKEIGESEATAYDSSTCRIQVENGIPARFNIRAEDRESLGLEIEELVTAVTKTIKQSAISLRTGTQPKEILSGDGSAVFYDGFLKIRIQRVPEGTSGERVR